MIKRSKFIYIIGSVIIGVTALLAVLFGLIAGGVINATSTKIVFSSSTEEFVYDGKAHRSGKWELTDGQLKKGHTARVTVSGSQTEVGSSENYISAVVVDSNGADVTEYYEIEYQPGILKVNARPITIASFDKSKIYDGTPLTYSTEDKECEIADGELVKGHTFKTVYTASVTEAGRIYNTFTPHIYDEKGREKTSNYAVTCDNGTLEVIKRKITVSSLGGEKEYDGIPLTNDGYKISENGLVEGHTESVEISGSRLNAGTSENKFTVTISDAKGAEVTHNYEIISEYGELTVNRREITITSADAAKEYDGTPLTADEYEMTSGSLSEGHKLSVEVTGIQTEAGRSGNTFTYEITDADGTNMNGNYYVISEVGALTVTKIALTITSKSAVKTYDGEPLTTKDEEDQYTINSEKLLEGHTEKVEVFGSQTDAGDGKNEFTVNILDAAGNDVTENYAIKSVLGVLRVKKKTIFVETASCYWEYDGVEHSHREWKMPDSSRFETEQPDGEQDDETVRFENTLVQGHEISEVVMLAKICEVGTCDNGISEIVITNGGEPVTDNYDVRVICGKLYVTPRTVTIRSGSAQQTYNKDSPLTCGISEDVYGKILKDLGHYYDIKITGTRTDPGESENTIEYVIIHDADGKDISYNYELTKSNGVLRVLPLTPPEKDNNNLDASGSLKGGNENDNLAVTVLSEKSGSVYLRFSSFGNYTGSGWEAVSKDYEYNLPFDGTHGANYLTSVALNNAGYKSYKIKIDVNGSDYLLPYYTDIYDCLYEPQTSDVKYSGETANAYTCYYYPYDYVTDGAIYGSKLSLGPYADYEIAYRNFVMGKYVYIDAATNSFMQGIIGEQNFKKSDPDIVGKVASYIRNAAVYDLKYPKALDFADNVAVSFLEKYGRGVCRHFASAATLLFRALEIPARYVTGYMCTAEAGEEVRLTGKNAHAWVEVYVGGMGWVKVEVTGSAANENDGRTVVKPVNEYYEYDGIIHRHSNTLQGLSAFKDYDFETSVSGSLSTAGKTVCKIEKFIVRLKATGEEVTEKFISENNIVFADGIMQVYLAEITVTTGSSEHTYDGTKTGSVDISCSGKILQGHKIAKLSPTGVQQNVGISSNTYEIKIVDEFGNDVTDMYRIASNYGTLKVTARALTVTANSKEVYFDESPTAEDGGYEIDGLADEHKAVVRIYGSQTGIGSSENKVASVKVYDKFGNDVTANYLITTVNGWLTVKIPD